MLRLQKYDFVMKYIKGTSLTIPDTLSRASLPDSTPEIPESELSCYVHSVMSALPISAEKHAEIVNATSKDSTLLQLQSYVLQGWPKTRQEIRPVVHTLTSEITSLLLMDCY